MKTRYIQVIVASAIFLVVILILIGAYLSLSSYSTTVSCTGEYFYPVYIGYQHGTSLSYVTQTQIQQTNTTMSAANGHIGSVYSTTVNYTTTAEFSGSIVTLNGGYSNMTCTYIR